MRALARIRLVSVTSLLLLACNEHPVGGGAVCQVRTAAACDGPVGACTEYTFDRYGGIRSTRQFAGDCDVGEPTSCMTYTLDAQGRLSEHRLDGGCDGVIDQRHSFDYDAQNRILVLRYERGLESVDEDYCSISTFTWQDMSETETEGIEDVDVGCDGTIDLPRSNCIRMTYDADGNVIAHDRDVGCNGSDEYCDQFEYDGAGRRTAHLYDDECVGVIDHRTRWEFDLEGRLTRAVDVNEQTGETRFCALATGECFEMAQAVPDYYAKP